MLQCFSGWNKRSFCSSPKVFQTTSQFLQATQDIDFLCNLCGVDFTNATAQSVRFFRVPQPLQKATGLMLTTAQDTTYNQSANPIILVAQVPNLHTACNARPSVDGLRRRHCHWGCLVPLSRGVSPAAAAEACLCAVCVWMRRQFLPRSIADFVFVSASQNLSQSVDIDTPSPTSNYWVAVYANNQGSFSLDARRRALGTSTSSNKAC